MAETLSKLSHEAWRVDPASLAVHLSGGTWKRARHLDYISSRLREELWKPNARIILSAGPRHGKTDIAAKWTPIWALDQFQKLVDGLEITVAAYNQDLSKKPVREAREIVEANSAELGWGVAAGNSKAQEWMTTEGGLLRAVGIKSGFTGKGTHGLVIDDPYRDWQSAYSPTLRERVWEWYEAVAGMRLAPGAWIIAMHTRWHHDDLIGRLLKHQSEGGDQWTVINLPTLAEPDDLLGRPEGMALWPERFSTKHMRKVRTKTSPAVFNALHQQRPGKAGGDMFPSTDWQTYTLAPARNDFVRLITSWDMTFDGKSTSDFVVGQLWGTTRPTADPSLAWFLEQWRGQWSLVETVDIMKVIVKRFPRAEHYVEKAANGSGIVSTLKKLFPELRGKFHLVDPVKSKVERAEACTPFLHRVRIPNAKHYPWIVPWLAEMEDFPRGEHDDQVDAFSQMGSKLLFGTGIGLAGADLKSPALSTKKSRPGIRGRRR